MRSTGTRCAHTASLVGVTAFALATQIVTAVSGQADGPASETLRTGPGVANHPVNMHPSERIRIPEGWPLASDGTITCLTCHSEIPARENDGNPRLRATGKLADGESFCTACHNDHDRSSATAAHWMAVDVAHVRPDQTASRGVGGRLDDDSVRCLSCHDGVNASEAQNMTSWNRGAGFNGPVSGNHPIGMPYPNRPSRGVEAGFRPASLLPREMQLPNGVVSCVSCHNLYGREKDLLSVPIEGSELCFTCHDMK